MAKKRKAVGKTTRFEVFKRDGFVCQYCGAHPPAVVLEVDHIEAVSSGGGNDIDNLVTACFDCNRGKAARPLSDVPKSLRDRAAEVTEAEAQIKGYQSAMEAKAKRIRKEVRAVCALYTELVPGYQLTKQSEASVRRFIDAIGVHAVKEAMEKACTNGSANEFRYFCGICWRIIKGDGR